MSRHALVFALCLAMGSWAATPLEVVKTPCPRDLAQHPMPACGFKDADLKPTGALVKAMRTTCQLALSPRFAAPDALALVVGVYEGRQPFNVSFIERADESRVVTSDDVREPVLTAAGVAGISYSDNRARLWLDGTCEQPREGNFDQLAVRPDGSFVTLWHRGDGAIEVVQRAPDGTWSSLGLVPYETRLVSQSGRVALVFSNNSSIERNDFGLFSPDTGRTTVFARLTTPEKFYAWGRSGVWVLAPPAEGARFSDAVNLKSAPYVDTPTLFRTDPVNGGQRVELPALAFKPQSCREPKNESEKVRGTWSMAADFVAANVDGTLLLARLESSGDCSAEFQPSPPFRCPPGAPCAPPQGPRLVRSQTTKKSEVVLFTVSPRDVVKELTRVSLPLTENNRSVGGLALSVTETRVWVMANQLRLEFDRVKLLGGAR